MKHLLCTSYWWLSDHADDIALAVVYTLLGVLASPLIIIAAVDMYENAVRDVEPVNEVYWQERGYEPLNTLPPTTDDL